jgi:molybdopterin-guanine dinucleotide biosynthesis protein A
MGTDKALLQREGRAMAAVVAETVPRACGHVSLVGSREQYGHLGIECLDEDFPGCGPLSGIEAALRSGQAEGNLVVAVDLFYLQSVWLEDLLHAAGTGNDQSVAASRDGRPEPLCAVYHRELHASVRTALEAGRYRAMDWLSHVSLSKFEADWVRQLTNVNTPADWSAYQETW